ncbi:hypothetical protein ABVK25_012238 [Lepraria finkii]|uniref:Uncharacterized protein n=1 Tax=Lepraria finkii TaxID=1340010 RepID=A0ABR4AH40_9LECA
MGFDCGFDIHPRLEATAENKKTYQRFLDEIVRTYNDVYDKDGRRLDGKVLEMPIDSKYSKDCITFMVGESGTLTTPAEPYIRNVYKIAKKYFGSSAHFWHEMNETDDEQQWGYYDWQEVHDAREKLREVETGQEGDSQNHAQEERGESSDEPSGPLATNSTSKVA